MELIRKSRRDLGATLLEQAFILFFLSFVALVGIEVFSAELGESVDSSSESISVAIGGESLTSAAEPIGGATCAEEPCPYSNWLSTGTNPNKPAL